MIADLKPYAEYKESGLPWLGQLPTHWGLIPNRGLVRRRKVLVGRRHGDYRLLSLTKQGVIVRDISTGKGKFSSDMGSSQEVRNGDLVFCLFDVPETPRTVGLARHDGMITGAYTVFESLGRGSSEYFELFYRAMDDRKLLSPLYSGLRNTIPAERLLGTKTPQPPPDEQAAIVRFLDWATGKLDRAIRAKRKVIALLNEQKQAIIHRAVTRGLDPTVPLKPSGIDWTPKIPQDWDQYPLRRLAICENSGSYGHDPSVGLRELPVATTAQINRDGRFDVVRMPRRGFTAAEVERFCCKPGDILVVKSSGSAANVISGKCGIVEPDTPLFVYSNFLARFSANVSLVQPRYLFLLLTSYITRERVKRMVSTTTYPNLRMGEYRGALLPVPPLGEQQRILEAVRVEVASVEQAASRLEREIELLREYRTRLFADVVTGKLDVREAAARLPDEAPLDSVEDAADLGDDIESEAEEIEA